MENVEEAGHGGWRGGKVRVRQGMKEGNMSRAKHFNDEG